MNASYSHVFSKISAVFICLLFVSIPSVNAQASEEPLKHELTPIHELTLDELQAYQLSHEKGRKRYVLIIVLLAFGVFILLAALFYRNKLHHRNLEKLATTDKLTGLSNRRHTLEQFDKKLVDAAKYKYNLCIAIVDLDWFKQVNERFGHFMGDKILRLFCDLCLNNLRETDLVGRVGGDRFLIVLPHVDVHHAFQDMDSLRLKMAEITEEVNMPNLVLTTSIGLCECMKDDTSGSVMRLVETALYRAKQNERNRLVLCDRRQPLDLL